MNSGTLGTKTDINTFIQDDAELLQKLNACAFDLVTIRDIYLKKIVSILPSISSNIHKLLIYGDELGVGTVDDLNHSFDTFLDCFTKHVIGVSIFFQHIEEKLKSINSSELPDFSNNTWADESKDIFNQVMSDLNDFGVFWILSEVFKETPLSFLTSLFAYGADGRYSGGNFVVGDGAIKLAELYNIVFDENYNIVSSGSGITLGGTALGAGAVAIYTAAKDLMNDEGDITNRDMARYGMDVGAAVVSYASWQGVLAVCEVASIGGPVATAAAATVGIVINLVYTPIKEHVVGDNIVYAFDEIITYIDPKTGMEMTKTISHEIPYNGCGPSGTYDVFLERHMDDAHFTHSGIIMTKPEYIYRIYNDWTEAIEHIPPGGVDYSKIEPFSNDLLRLRNASTKEEAKLIIEEMNKAYGPQYDANGERTSWSLALLEELDGQGFTLDNYYSFTHNGDSLND